MRVFGILLVLLASGLSASAQWIKQNVDTTASFRGLSVVNEKVVWASGTSGTVIKTIDSGKTWKVMTVPGAEKLDFRDIEAFDANTAYILSIGNGASSRIYKTTDGGATWRLKFTNDNEKAFFDAIACWNANGCIAMSDPVDGFYVFVSTNDGGDTWRHYYENKFAAKDGEAAFAASGTCLIAQPYGRMMFVSGGNAARVFSAGPGKDAWVFKAAETPLARGSGGSGIFSIAMFDLQNGVIVGGNYEKPEQNTNSLAFTVDAGFTWTPGSGLSGYRSGVTYVDKNTIIAVGTNGSDMTTDGGKSWKKIGDQNLNAVAAKGKSAVWAVGPKGVVVKMK